MRAEPSDRSSNAPVQQGPRRDPLPNPANGPGRLDLSELSDCEYSVVQRFGPDGGFIEGWLVAEGPNWLTALLPPGTRLHLGETNEEVLSWSVVQWQATAGVVPQPPSDARRQTMRATSIRELLPDSLKDWVRQATKTSIGLLDFLIDTDGEEDPRIGELLRRRREDLVAQLGELTYSTPPR
jgi:hypothetical protein